MQPINKDLFAHLGKATIPHQLRKWLAFSSAMGKHLMQYAIPQYGDVDDLIATYTPEECARQIQRYAMRHGKNARPGQDALDMLKIAHIAQRCYDKIVEADPSLIPYPPEKDDPNV